MVMLHTMRGFAIGSSAGFFIMTPMAVLLGKEDVAFVYWSLAMLWLGFLLTASFLLKRGGDR